jgi:hypothetical protein
MISEIELVPLTSDTVNMLRTEIWCKHGYCPVPEFKVHSKGPEIIVTDTGYLLSDPGQDRIYRYSKDGKFINPIGSTESEDQMMMNAQIYDGKVHVYYSNPFVEKCYEENGSMISNENLEDAGFAGWMTKEGRLAWYGYGSGRPGRLGLWKGNDSTVFLPSDAKVLYLDLDVPIFTMNGKNVLFVDGTRSTVMQYRKGQVVCRDNGLSAYHSRQNRQNMFWFCAMHSGKARTQQPIRQLQKSQHQANAIQQSCGDAVQHHIFSGGHPNHPQEEALRHPSVRLQICLSNLPSSVVS